MLTYLLSPKVSAVSIDIVRLRPVTPSGALFTCLSKCDNATARSHMDLIIPFGFFFIISVLNDFCNVREFLSAQLVVSNGSLLMLDVFQFFI